MANIFPSADVEWYSEMRLWGEWGDVNIFAPRR